MTFSAAPHSNEPTPVALTAPTPPGTDTQVLLHRLLAFALPGGEDAARAARGVRLTYRGELRSGPTARWIPFTAEETIDAVRSGFRWDARLRTGPVGSVTITDLYEGGHGRAGVKLGGLVPVASAAGPDYDRGELQRYLAEIVLCPAALVVHPSLIWTTVGPGTLRLRDSADPTGAAVDLDLDDAGQPVACRSDRPRTVGKQTVETPWSAIYADPGEWEGLRVPTRLEADWHLPAGPFTYVREELISLVALR